MMAKSNRELEREIENLKFDLKLERDWRYRTREDYYRLMRYLGLTVRIIPAAEEKLEIVKMPKK